MKIVSALVGLLRYETKSLTDIHQLKNGRSPQPQSPCKHLKYALAKPKISPNHPHRPTPTSHPATAHLKPHVI